MVFGEVVLYIVVCFTPVDAELALAEVVTDPVEAHINVNIPTITVARTRAPLVW